MNAKNETGNGTGGKRVKLVEQLPLTTPFGIVLMPIYACNFRCNYCIYTLPKEKHGLHYKTDIMSFDTLKRAVDGATKFEKKLKILRIAGNGEPLLHPDIDKMVTYISQNNITDNIEILTNGLLLSPDMSERIIKSGLTQIRISLQGLCAEDYKKTADVDIDFDKFVSNVKYLYEHKSNLKVGVKIMSTQVDSDDKKNRLWEIFGNIADFISIEEVSPVVSKVDYKKYGFSSSDTKGKETSVRGFHIPSDTHICHFPFYLMMINPDGTIYPCCSVETPPSMGNVNEENLKDIWNGAVFNTFRKTMLSGVESCGNVCKNCKAYLYNLFEEDIITDDDAKHLITQY